MTDSQKPIATCCPVCNGTGRVPHEFYNIVFPNRRSGYVTQGVITVRCKSCNAKGYVVIREEK